MGSKGIPCHSNGQNDLSYTQTNVIISIISVEIACTWNLQVANFCTVVVTVTVGLIYINHPVQTIKIQATDLILNRSMDNRT
jgi:hypothetical protein